MKTFLKVLGWIGTGIMGAMANVGFALTMCSKFGGFISDVAYKAAHPRMYYLKYAGLIGVIAAFAFAVIMWPINWLSEVIDEKVDDYFDDAEISGSIGGDEL